MEQSHVKGIRTSRKEGEQQVKECSIHGKELDPTVVVSSVTETGQHLFHPDRNSMLHTRITENALHVDSDTSCHDKLPSLSGR